MKRESHYSFQVLVGKKEEERMLEAEAYLNEAYNRHGISLCCAPSRNQGRKGLKRYSLIIRVDEETMGRGAGRKETAARYGMDEAIKQEASGKDKKSIAKEMGISLATYYRRRKKYMAEGS